MSNYDHTLDTLRYANGVKIRNLDRGVLVTSVVEIKKHRENEKGGNLQGRPVSTTSRWNDLIHVDSGLSLESKLLKAIPVSLDMDYSLDN